MSKIITGLKASEVVKFFEDGKAEGWLVDEQYKLGCELFKSIDKLFLEEAIRKNQTFSVKLKPQKIEITEEQLDKAWAKAEQLSYSYGFISSTERTFKFLKKALGFHD